jgi:hypothetical protein
MISRSLLVLAGWQVGGGYQSGRSIHKCLKMDLAGLFLLWSKALALTGKNRLFSNCI